MVWVVGQGIRRGVNRRRSGRPPWAAGGADGARGEAKASTQNQAWRWRGDRRDLSRFIEIYREIMEAVDEAVGPAGEAKASTQNQAWRRAYGRMGGGQGEAGWGDGRG